MKTIKLKLPDDREIYLYNRDGADAIASKIYWDGLEGFETAEIELFLKLLESCNTFIDVGANTGIYSLIAGVNKKQVYAFEPVPTINNRLCQNIQINNLSSVVSVSSAVGDYNGSITIYIPNSLSIPTMSSTLKGFNESEKQLVVPLTTLDTYVFMNDIPKVDLIKIDVEATEDKVLLGSMKVIKRDSPLILCEVLHNRCEKMLNAFFEATDYRFFMVTDIGLISKERIEGDDAYPNYLFVSEAKLKDLGGLDNLIRNSVAPVLR